MIEQMCLVPGCDQVAAERIEIRGDGDSTAALFCEQHAEHAPKVMRRHAERKYPGRTFEIHSCKLRS